MATTIASASQGWWLVYSMRRSMLDGSGRGAGHKKGAHYSAPMTSGPLPRVGALALGAAVVVLGSVSGSAAATKTQSEAQKAESELQSVKSEIDRISKQVSSEQVEHDRQAKELRSVELSVGKARESLEVVRRERAESASHRATLATQKKESQASIAKERGALAGQLRAAYLIGHEETLKLLLNQQDPARAGRMFVYYSYFGRERAQEIHSIEDNVARIDQLDTELRSEERR